MSPYIGIGDAFVKVEPAHSRLTVERGIHPLEKLESNPPAHRMTYSDEKRGIFIVDDSGDWEGFTEAVEAYKMTRRSDVENPAISPDTSPEEDLVSVHDLEPMIRRFLDSDIGDAGAEVAAAAHDLLYALHHSFGGE